MESGKLRERVEFQNFVQTRDPQGGFINTWQEFKKLWAEVTPLNGTEPFYGDKVMTIHDYSIKIRFYPGIDTTMRIIYDGKELNILSRKDIKERHRTIILLCKEKIDGG